MGNSFKEKLEKIFPKTPKEINFPECEKKYDIKMTEINSVSQNYFEEKIYYGKYISLLNSGNVLIAYDEIDSVKQTIYSYLKIYTVPDLEFVQEYIFPNESRTEIFRISAAFQLKNGNILAIRDKLYEFEGESIKDGPKRSSSKLADHLMEVKPIRFTKKITKETYEFIGKYFDEIIEGKIFFMCYWKSNIICIDYQNLEIRKGNLFDADSWNLDLIFRSEINPKLLYICKNDYNVQNRKSELDAYDINEFFDLNKKEKKVIFNFTISKSRNVFGYCEYDNKYLLLDTIFGGIYVFDMETKTKVAVCNINDAQNTSKLYGEIKIKDYYSKKMMKLDDGQIFKIFPYPTLIDVREGTFKREGGLPDMYVLKGKNLIVEFSQSCVLSTSKIYE